MKSILNANETINFQEATCKHDLQPKSHSQTLLPVTYEEHQYQTHMRTHIWLTNISSRHTWKLMSGFQGFQRSKSQLLQGLSVVILIKKRISFQDTLRAFPQKINSTMNKTTIRALGGGVRGDEMIASSYHFFVIIQTSIRQGYIVKKTNKQTKNPNRNKCQKCISFN